jgi:signal transduction histidine kinase
MIILIVDDEAEGRETLAALLAAHEYRLAFAKSGIEALQQARDLRPDLILLDATMPDIDGLAVCRRLRDDTAIDSAPIVLLIGLDDREMRIRGIEAGADDFVSKPFDRIELRARVATLMRLIGQRRLLEDERRQLTYELHDGLAQTVVSVHQHLQAYAARRGMPADAKRAELDRILDLAHRSATEVRYVIAGLRPAALDDFGLAAALQMQIRALHADGWTVSYHETLGAERVTPAIETALYRVAQEALTNVRKHARTTRVAVTLERNKHSLRLTIRDWGCGFEPAQAIESAGMRGRIGLRGMHERVALLGGRWDIHSSPGAGVLITAEIPLPSEPVQL